MERFVIATKEHESLTLQCKLFQNLVHMTLALGKTSVLSDQRKIQLKIFTSAASPALATPETLHVVMGYTFKHLGSASTSAGAPSTVNFVQSGGEKLQFTFAEGSSIGIPTPGVYKDLPERVQMVDANGWATLTEPVYYDLYPGDGSVWRFMATDLTGELGKLVSFTDPRGRVLTNDDFGVDIVRASNGLLRQVLTPSRLADIVTRGSTGYTVTVYPLTELPAFANGLYALPPHAATEVLTVDRGEDVNHLIVTLKKGGASAQRYAYTYVNGDWTMVHPDGVVEQKEIYYGDNEDTAMMVKLVKDTAGHIYSRRENLYVSKGWGFAMTNCVEGLGSAKRSTSWWYVSSGAAVGKVSEKKDSTGAWVKYAYDANGRKISETHPNLGEVVTTSYAPVDPEDQILLNDIRPRTVIRTINNIEVERTYYAYTTNRQEIVERCATQGAAYGAEGNLRTVTTWYPAAEDDYSAGRLQSVRHEDGQMDVYTYSWVNSVWTETVTRVHEDEPDPVAMQTTRRLKIYNRIGNLVAERTELMTASGVWEQIGGAAYEYNVNGKETKRTTFNGLVTTSEWAGTCCGKSSETAPDGTRTTFTYDDSGRLIVRTVLDPNPIETHIGYDAIGRQIISWTTNRVAHLGTTPLRTVYDALGRVVSQTDKFGNITSTAYSANERTELVTYPVDSTEITVIDESGRPISVTGTAVAPRTYTHGINADGTTWMKVYNGANASVIAWAKATQDMLRQTIREEKPGFNGSALVTTYTYDNGGRVLSLTQADATNPANTVVMSKNLSKYDRYGDLSYKALDVNQNGIIDFSGPDRVTGYTTTYISKNNALWQESTQCVYPDFNSDRAVTTAKSRQKLTNLGDFASVSESEDIYGNVTTTTTTVDRETGTTISSTTVPTSIQPQVQIQRYGQLVESISTSAVTNRYAYDTLNRRVAVTDGRGNTSITAYNVLGQVAYTEDAATNRTSYIYDQYGRQIETIDALNQPTYTVYDRRGNVVKQYGATYPVWYEYDAEGRMIAMATTRDTTLDPATVDTLNHPFLDVTRWVYDPATGLLVQKLYDDGKGPSYTYTPDGKLATRTWARGVETEYGYDVLGQLVGIDYSDTTPDVAYAYDRLGRQLSAVAAGVSTNLYAYSTNTLELVTETQNSVVIERSSGVNGLSTGLSLPLPLGEGQGEGAAPYSVAYGYDTFGRFGAVTSYLPLVTNHFAYSYLSGSSLVSGMTASTGHAWTRSYEQNRNFITAVTNSFNGNLISAFVYTNDEIGRRTARVDSLPEEVATTNAFGYNMRSEVTCANMGTNTYGYVFDSIGNRIVETNNMDVASYTANGLNQYTVISNTVPVQPVHDDDGNMLTNGVFSYTWDGENRLRSVLSNNVLLVTYTYDHRSRRIGKTVDGTTHFFIYDGWNLIQETFGTNASHYVWGLDASGSRHGAGGVGGLLAVISPLPLGEGQGEGSTVYLPCYDANGNVTDYTDAFGMIVAHYEYSLFGETVLQVGSKAGVFDFRFSSKYLEEENGLYYYGYRFEVPVIGRWLNRDPLWEVGGLGLYVTCENNLVTQFDSDGRWTTLSDCKKLSRDYYALDWVKQLYKWNGSKGNVVPCVMSFNCMCCNSDPSEDRRVQYAGIYDPFFRHITICYDNSFDIDDLEVSIRHEYSHAESLCGKTLWSCDTCMKEEKKACHRADPRLNDLTCTDDASRSCARQCWYVSDFSDYFEPFGWPVTEPELPRPPAKP